ncbi:uncharacterized protein LOC120129847 [Hibiscus syriacus]|uniref:uncharacterized protein LOC120129847 n=1 Tax=Hibiscus syriacus TaxID=106335 RepID=UPI00192299C2|nr:uncharacterized protein LOC120129847 [Hibiscus syriacus]
MDACHQLLERPWKFDKKAIHDGYTNRYSFFHNERKVILNPLSPSQVTEDQNSLKRSIEASKYSKEDEPKKMNIYVRENDIMKHLSTNKALIVLMYKESFLLTNPPEGFHSPILNLLKDLKNYFLRIFQVVYHLSEELSTKSIIPGATIPNRPAYRSNPEETKEL